MKTFTFEELEKKFGVSYRSSILGIEETFVGWGLWEEDNLYTDEESAREATKEVWYTRYNNQVKRIEDLLDVYKALPWYTRAWSFVFKRGWKVNTIVKEQMQKFEDELAESLKKVDGMKIGRLSRGSYTLNTPLLEVGQTVYVSVTHNNHLDMGVHAFTVEKINYNVGNENTIRYTARITSEKGGGIRLETCNDRLSTGWAYHEVHLDKQEAVDRVKEYLQKQAEKVKQQLKNMEE